MEIFHEVTGLSNSSHPFRRRVAQGISDEGPGVAEPLPRLVTDIHNTIHARVLVYKAS